MEIQKEINILKFIEVIVSTYKLLCIQNLKIHPYIEARDLT